MLELVRVIGHYAFGMSAGKAKTRRYVNQQGRGREIAAARSMRQGKQHSQFVLTAQDSLSTTQKETLEMLTARVDQVRPRPGLVARRLMALDAWRALRGLAEWTPEMVAAVEGVIQ